MAASRLDTFDGGNISNLVYAMDRLAYRDEEAFLRLADTASRKALHLRPQALARVARGFANAGFRQKELFEKASRASCLPLFFL